MLKTEPCVTQPWKEAVRKVSLISQERNWSQSFLSHWKAFYFQRQSCNNDRGLKHPPPFVDFQGGTLEPACKVSVMSIESWPYTAGWPNIRVLTQYSWFLLWPAKIWPYIRKDLTSRTLQEGSTVHIIEYWFLFLSYLGHISILYKIETVSD